MRIVSAAGAAILTALVGVPIVGAFISPTLQKPKGDNWIKVADDTALLDIGVPIRVDFVQTQDDAWIESRALLSVWLYTEDGDKFKAYNGHCTHLGCGFLLSPGQEDLCLSLSSRTVRHQDGRRAGGTAAAPAGRVEGRGARRRGVRAVPRLPVGHPGASRSVG